MNSNIVSMICVGMMFLATACVDNPDKAQDHYDLAIEHQRADRPEEAIEEYTKAIDAFPNQYQS